MRGQATNHPRPGARNGEEMFSNCADGSRTHQFTNTNVEVPHASSPTEHIHDSLGTDSFNLSYNVGHAATTIQGNSLLFRPSGPICTSLPVSTSERAPLSMIDQNIPINISSPTKTGNYVVSRNVPMSLDTRPDTWNKLNANLAQTSILPRTRRLTESVIQRPSIHLTTPVQSSISHRHPHSTVDQNVADYLNSPSNPGELFQRNLNIGNNINLNVATNSSGPTFGRRMPHSVLQRPPFQSTTPLLSSISQRTPLSTINQNVPVNLDSSTKPGTKRRVRGLNVETLINNNSCNQEQSGTKRRVRGKNIENVLSQIQTAQSTSSTNDGRLLYPVVHSPADKENSFPNTATNYQTPRSVPQCILQFPTPKQSSPLISSGNVTSVVTEQHISTDCTQTPGAVINARGILY